MIRLGEGFGCIHPWPGLGDPTVDDVLQELREIDGSGGIHNLPEGLLKAGCEAALLDGEARGSGVSLFKSGRRLENHASLVLGGVAEVEEAVDRGFEVMKLKVDGQGDLQEVVSLIQRFPDLSWRLDFNGTGVKESFGQLREVSDQIDFIEDPMVGGWGALPETLGVAVARDFLVLEGAEVGIWKPAREKWSGTERRVVVTSCLDHPVGQSFAAARAAELGGNEVMGLQSHLVYEENEFSECLGTGSVWQSLGGTGVGFDELLEKLPWKLVR